MEKQKIYEFDPQIYPRKVWVTVGVPFEELKDEFEDLKPMEEGSYAQVDHLRKLKPEVRGGLLVRFENLDTLKKFGNMKKATQANVMHWLLNQSVSMSNILEEGLIEDSFVLQ